MLNLFSIWLFEKPCAMSEWHCEKYRQSIEKKMMQPGAFSSDIDGFPIYIEPKPTERVFLLGVAWQAKGTISSPPTEAARRLLVMTSRNNLAILEVPVVNGPETWHQSRRCLCFY